MFHIRVLEMPVSITGREIGVTTKWYLTTRIVLLDSRLELLLYEGCSEVERGSSARVQVPPV